MDGFNTALNKAEERPPQYLLCNPTMTEMRFSGFSCLTNASRGNGSCLCSCPVHKENLLLCKTLWAVHHSLVHWDKGTWFSAFCYTLLCCCGCLWGGSAKECPNSPGFGDCASPLRWALHGIKLIQEYKEKHNRDSHIFRQHYLLIISSPPSRYYFHPCMHFCCEFLSAEIDPLKFGSLRDKFADIRGSCEA